VKREQVDEDMKEHAKVTQSRQAIQEAGIETLLRNPDAGMSEIALAAGVGRATLYRHYESREALVQSLTKLCLDETDELMKPLKAQKLRGRQAIEAAIDAVMPMAARFRFLMSLWAIASNDKVVLKIYRRQLRELGGYVEQAQEDDEIVPSLSVAWVVSMFDALLNSAWFLVENGTMDIDEATAAFKHSLFCGCATAGLS